MLTRLHIRNLAVLDEIEIDLAQGFSALTGETGAGKSMLVDALALALGERADSSAVRTGASRAEVTAIFDVGRNASVGTWLNERDLDAGRECQVRRVLTPEGRSRGYINGQQVPMESLRELGEQLIEICGQHAHQSLVRRSTQREILDAHGDHRAHLVRMSQAFEAWTAIEVERQALASGQRDRQARQELLGYQVRELEALNLQEGEVEILEQERLLLINAGRISAGLSVALDRLYDAEQGSAHDAIGHALRDIGTLAGVDPALTPAIESLEQSRIQLCDASDLIRRRLSRMEHDPVRQDAIESRLASAQDLARKHRTEPERLWQLAAELSTELTGLNAGDSRLDEIAEASVGLRNALRAAADSLHAAREVAAGSLAKAVTTSLRSLGMTGSIFLVNVDSLPVENAGPTGADDIEFRITTNAGQLPQPIAKVASGGELSRLSLAIQVVAMTDHGAPTLIFDEVDAGIGGGVAEIVGHYLKRLSSRRQVLCVTHLAQVASQADHHFAVTKSVAGKVTRTAVQELDTNARIDEVARMLGGVRITDLTRDHAKEMLQGVKPRRTG